jgi:hypothetical protein
MQRKQTDDECEGKPEGGGKKVAHAPAPLNAEKLLLRPAAEKTVKVHQSWIANLIANFSGSQKASASLFCFAANFLRMARCIRLL